MSLNLNTTRDRLQKFEFARLFIDELGWSNPKSGKPVTAQFTAKNTQPISYTRTPIAQLSGVVAFEVTTFGGIPDAKTRAAIQKQVSEEHVENLLIFLDKDRTQSLWYWVKREAGKSHARDHLYVKGQPGDLFISKLAAMVVDISELDAQGNIAITEVASRLKKALDVERVTKKFYGEFSEQHLAFLELIQGIPDDRQRHWYASVLLNRLMFIYFLQRKFFLDSGDERYLQNKLDQSKKSGKDRYYAVFLNALFFEGFAKPETQRSEPAKKLLGKIKYLNGGLFLPHAIEEENKNIRIPDIAFENILKLFERYSWNLNDTPAGKADEINPDVLGYIFEKYINQKEFGAYYTRPEITEYLCEQTIYKLVLDRINIAQTSANSPKFYSIAELLLNLDAPICRRLLEILPQLSLLDPACGSGAFLVAAMKTLINLYSAVIGKVEFLNDPALTKWFNEIRREHPSPAYYIKKRIITDNLYGVDIMEEATEIARLRLFLALIASAQNVEQLEPLPNIDFNILAGNSLIGLLRVDAAKFDGDANGGAGEQGRMTLQHGSDLGFTVESKTAPTKKEAAAAFLAGVNAAKFTALLERKNKSIELYKKHAFALGEVAGLKQEERLLHLRSDIENVRHEAYTRMNDMLLKEFQALGIVFQEATWDEKKNTEGKPIKRPLKLADIEALHPFHWGYEFDQVLLQRGGFDAIITNPPWEIFKPNAKEFFEQYSELVTKKKMAIHDFEKAQAKLLKDSEIKAAWLEYLSGYPHVSAFYRSTPQYKNQISIVDGKKTGSDTNLYKLFTEQCYNLLHGGGYCGIVIPSGIYTDLGTKQLREMLFNQSKLTGLFCFENRKEIFENVDSRFKFVALTFEKGGATKKFPAAFMRHEVAELARFPQEGAIPIPTELVRRLSPDSLSITEFKTMEEVLIVEKFLRFPFLNDEKNGWGLEIYGEELHMNRSAYLFKTHPTKFPLFEGGMIWHFEHQFEKPQYWINEKDVRQLFLEKRVKRIPEMDSLPEDMTNDYETLRLGIRKIASNTNERTLATTIIPANCFAGNSLAVHFPFRHDKKFYNQVRYSGRELLVITSLLNSFVVDYFLRPKMTTNLNTFYLYQLPVPRLTEKDAAFMPIVTRAAKLICTTPEFDDLAKEVGLGSHKQGATDPAARARLRAELDGLIAHLYGLTESEFAYILTTFPIVAQPVKDAALEAFRAFTPKTADVQLAADIARGESATLEFKSSARWDFKEGRVNKAMEQVIVKTAAAFLNTDGGTLLIGMDDSGKALGLEHDFKTLGKKQNRDGYENFLTTLLLNEFGKDCAPMIQTSFCQLEGKDVCRLTFKPSPKPAFVKDGTAEHLFIRAGNSTRQLTTKEALDYCKQRWP